ncbi:MAG TPA: phosphate ABC transporter permease PstA [Planctomycetota bacterium]|nr:phosphate ABC transporter permease PstA [Planctomycetota bacterium]
MASAAARDRAATIVMWSVAAGITAVFVWLLGDLLWHGVGRVSWDFLVSLPKNAGREGGLSSVLVATVLILLVCMVASIPLGVATAVLLAEFSGEGLFARLVRRSLDVLAGVPSIVFGLFGNAFFCKALGMGFSILSGGLTLACMVLPIFIRATEEGLRAAPNEYRLGAAALGISRVSTLFRLLLPAAVPGLMVGFILGLGRAIAETAALIFTSGYVDRMPESLLDSGRALTVHIYDLSMNVPGGDRSAYGSALVLIVMLLGINSAAWGIARRWQSRSLLRV